MAELVNDLSSTLLHPFRPRLRPIVALPDLVLPKIEKTVERSTCGSGFGRTVNWRARIDFGTSLRRLNLNWLWTGVSKFKHHNEGNLITNSNYRYEVQRNNSFHFSYANSW